MVVFVFCLGKIVFCDGRVLVFELLLLDEVFLLGFKIFNILVCRFVCCLVIDWGFIVGWFD